MLLFILSYLGGVLTIVSPCILPVLPFVFARADRPFLRNGLPMLIGMAVMFALVATLAAVGGNWVVQANEYGRNAAMVVLALVGLALVFPALSDRWTRPIVALGSRLSQSVDGDSGNQGGIPWSSLLLGVATGLLWAPCAGPILGLILASAALDGATVQTTFLLIAYAAGAATSLALALFVGGRVFTAMKRSLGVGEWVRRGTGVLVLVAVVAIALGVDTGVLTKISLARTASLEQGLLDTFHSSANGKIASQDSRSPSPMPAADKSAAMMVTSLRARARRLPVEGEMPPLSGAVEWLNSPPLTRKELKGKVVLVDFWTYSCINCLRSIPYVRAWAKKYQDQGLVVIGVHSPEFAFEKDIGNVKDAIANLDITYPVAVDNHYAIWKAFQNHYWPAHYFIDAQGRIRHHHFGEGEYDESERVIRELLAEAGQTDLSAASATVKGTGVEAASDRRDVRSSETYIGYNRAEHFVSPGDAVEDSPHEYRAGMPQLNEWGLSGNWTIGGEHATLNSKEGSIVFRFHARDLHLVLGPPPGGKSIQFRVTIDGKAPGDDHGTDIGGDGRGIVTGQRLYQLIRQSDGVTDRTFEIHFFEPGVQAYAFTFG